MAEPAKNKVEAFAKSRKMKYIFLALIVLLLIAAGAYAVIYFFKKRKAAAVLDAEKKPVSNNTNVSIPSGASSNLESYENTMAIQRAINKAHPEAALEVDGIMGPMTKAGIKKYYGESAYPLTGESLSKIISGQAISGYSPSVKSEQDDFPLVIGSHGNLVVAVKNIINTLEPKAKLNTKSDVFDAATYNALITYVGTSYYPVTYDNYILLSRLYNTETDPLFNPNG